MDSSIDIGLEPVAGAAQALAPPASVQPPVRINTMNFSESPMEGAPEAQPGPSAATALHTGLVSHHYQDTMDAAALNWQLIAEKQ